MRKLSSLEGPMAEVAVVFAMKTTPPTRTTAVYERQFDSDTFGTIPHAALTNDIDCLAFFQGGTWTITMDENPGFAGESTSFCLSRSHNRANRLGDELYRKIIEYIDW